MSEQFIAISTSSYSFFLYTLLRQGLPKQSIEEERLGNSRNSNKLLTQACLTYLGKASLSKLLRQGLPKQPMYSKRDQGSMKIINF